jgi:hypothetical protein
LKFQNFKIVLENKGRNYSREKTIHGRKLLKGGHYLRKYGSKKYAQRKYR